MKLVKHRKNVGGRLQRKARLKKKFWTYIDKRRKQRCVPMPRTF